MGFPFWVGEYFFRPLNNVWFLKILIPSPSPQLRSLEILKTGFSGGMGVRVKKEKLPWPGRGIWLCPRTTQFLAEWLPF